MGKVGRPTYVFLIVILLFVLSACGSDGMPTEQAAPDSPADTPQTAVSEWLEAMINGDGATLITRTCQQEHETVQNLGLIRSLVGIFGEETVGDKGSGSIEGINMDLMKNDGQTAHVRVQGELVSSVLAVGVAQEVDETWIMIKDGDRWKWCGIVGSEGLADAEADQGPVSESLTYEWEILTGDIDDFVIAEDGMIYGLIFDDVNRHVQISPDGEVLAVTELGSSRDGTSFRSGNSKVSTHKDGTFVVYVDEKLYIVSPDGRQAMIEHPGLTFLGGHTFNMSNLGDYAAFAHVYSDENLPEVTDSDVGSYYFYHLDKESGLVLDRKIPLPELLDISLFSEGERFLAYENEQLEQLVLHNAHGDVVYEGVPQGMDMSERFSSYLTPWGDLWLAYEEVDALGNSLGQTAIKIDNNGKVSRHDAFPPDEFQPSRIRYLLDRDEIYFIDGEVLVRLDRDFQPLESFTYPEEYLRRANAQGKIVGYDGNLYDWDTGQKLLRKFAQPEKGSS